MFKKPKHLERLPPEKVVIQVSVKPVESESVKVASIIVSTTDWELSYPDLKSDFHKSLINSNLKF